MFDFIDIIVKGGPVMVPLLACSIIALTVVIERFLFWRRIGNRQAAEAVLELVERGDLSKAADSARQTDSPLVRVMASGLAHRNPSVTQALEVAAQREVPVLKQRLTILDTIITLAPLLGLLGTVTGMIGSFGIMSQVGLGQPHAVTGGVAEALIATATGLLIAILTLVPYNYFSNRAEREMEEIEYYASRLDLALERRTRKKVMRLRRREIKKARIEIIPMIDTIFFLLVFFMISTLSMARYSGLPVNLPKAATGQQPPSESAAVTVGPDGKVSIDKQEVARERIAEILRARLAKNSELLVLINADEKVEHGIVVEIMDAARQAGVTKMAIAVKPKEAR